MACESGFDLTEGEGGFACGARLDDEARDLVPEVDQRRTDLVSQARLRGGEGSLVLRESGSRIRFESDECL